MKNLKKYFFICLCFLPSMLSAIRPENNTEIIPNVIFILTDDQGFGDLGIAGHPYMKTPNIDRLANEGILFNRFYVNATVCSPSRVSFMTGQFPARQNCDHIYNTPEKLKNDGIPEFLDPGVLTVADIMKEAGYRTGHIGKWHLSNNTDKVPEAIEYGFDFNLFTRGHFQSLIYKTRISSTSHHVTKSSQWIMEDAIDFIEQCKNENRAFYLNLWTHVPHAPLNPSTEELAVYENLKVNPEDFKSWMKEYSKNTTDLDAQMKIYCASMTSLDYAIGELIDYLDSTGLSKNTLILFTSDNGPEDYHIQNAQNAGVGSSGIFRGRKRSIYEGGVRVPCIVRWPGHVPYGETSNTIWSAVDWLPTLAMITGVDLPPNFIPDGEDVTDIICGAKRERTKPLYWEWKFPVFGNQYYFPPQLAILDGDWKFYCNPDGSYPALYNLSVDPEERENLANMESNLVEKLKNKLLAWKKTLPVKDNLYQEK